MSETYNYDSKPKDELDDEMYNAKAMDPIQELQKRAADNLKRIGFVSMQDILQAFGDKDREGRLTTVIELKVDHWNPLTRECLWSRSRAVSMAAEIKLERAGGYSTLILQFSGKDHPDMNLIWAVLSEYGKESADIVQPAEDVPLMNITVVPMSLGGKYGMIATDPVFWCLQPRAPFESDCTQIRILYQPESIIFLRDDNIDSDEVVAKVKNELATEKLTAEAILQKQIEEEEFKKQRESEMEQYFENQKNKKHSFSTSKKEQ